MNSIKKSKPYSRSTMPMLLRKILNHATPLAVFAHDGVIRLTKANSDKFDDAMVRNPGWFYGVYDNSIDKNDLQSDLEEIFEEVS